MIVRGGDKFFQRRRLGDVAELVGIEVGVISEVINLESSGIVSPLDLEWTLSVALSPSRFGVSIHGKFAEGLSP